MTDDSFEDADLARYYDSINTGGPDDDFYLALVMSAASVLDLGCGTGRLLKAARDAGHTGRLCGLDPARGMLARARTRPDVEWVRGDLGTTTWDHEFDLVVITGHAFQVFLTDDEVRSTFTAIRRALVPDGRLAFETRNPAARAWERWTPGNGTDITGPDGDEVRVEHRVLDVTGDLVRFSETFDHADGRAPRVSSSTLRFLPADALDALLGESGFAVEERFGAWDRTPFTATSREIITVARPAHHSATGR